jgi:hypothetical protein
MDDSVVGTIGAGASWTWDRREQIGRYLRGIYDWFRGQPDATARRPGILILGAGGAGKSTLGKILGGQYDLLLDPIGEYSESVSVEEYSLKDDSGVEIYVPPGQAHRRDSTWTELLAGVCSGDYRGIILLNAFGYHTIGRISYRDLKVYKKHGDSAFLDSYVRDRQAEEVAIVKRIGEAVRLSNNRLWMLSLITKQDLWWNQRATVESHYESGNYGKAIEELTAQCGAHRFRHELAFASLVISNFETGMKEPLWANSEGYDQRLQVQSLRRLFEIVASLKQWEGKP